MIVFTSTEFTKKLKHIAGDLNTAYQNVYPYNLGYRHSDGHYSFDCWNLIKSLIWGWHESDTIGYFAAPNFKTGLGDWDGETILKHCTDVTTNFASITPGEYLVNAGITHAGTYVGDFTANGKTYNVIECTPAFGGGVVRSYVDAKGRRLSCKGGYQETSWTQHGKLPWVDYKDEKKQQTVTICVYDDINKQWLAEVHNTTTTADYAGIFGSDVDNVMIRLDGGTVKYKVHTWKGDAAEKYPNAGKWLEAVTGYNKNDSEKGFAGDNTPIDAICISASKELLYRAHLRKSGEWLEWVSSKNANEKDAENGYAGIIGLPIDALEIKLK